MTNVISWTEAEIGLLVQVWSEVEAKYPLLRCPPGAGTLHAKVFALYSKRCTFPRSSSALNRMKHTIRSFVLFVHKYNEDRRKDGGREWFNLSMAERKQRRPLVERKLWGLACTVNQETFARLMTMERTHRWLNAESLTTSKNREGEVQKVQAEQTGAEDCFSYVQEFSPQSESSTPSTERSAEKGEDRLTLVASRHSRSNSCSSRTGSDDRSSEFDACKSFPLTTPSRTEFQGKLTTEEDMKIRGKIKHRECGILLENMMKLQNKKMRRAVTKLRANIEGEIQRSSEMLHSIISNQFEDPESSGDVAFMTKVLNMQKQQVCDRFDQFEEKRTHEEAANRALLG